jgi:hypothetical protein
MDSEGSLNIPVKYRIKEKEDVQRGKYPRKVSKVL